MIAVPCYEFYILGSWLFPINQAAWELPRMRFWRLARVHFDLTADNRRSFERSRGCIATATPNEVEGCYITREGRAKSRGWPARNLTLTVNVFGKRGHR